MHRRIIGWALPLLLLASAATARAESESEEPPPPGLQTNLRLGIGVGIDVAPFVIVGDDAGAGLPSSFASFRIPVRIGERLRIEPEIGFFHQTGGLGPGFLRLAHPGGVDLRTTSTRVAVAAQWVFRPAEGAEAYVGPKVGLQQRTLRIGDPPLDEEIGETLEELRVEAVDYWVAATLGGEAFLHPALSLGAELAFAYVNLGRSTYVVDGLGVPSNEIDDGGGRQWMLSTSATLLLRFYFF